MRRNHSRKSRRRDDRYTLDYIILAKHPEIDHIIVEPSRTVYKNLAACEDAPFSPVIKHNDDPALGLLTGRI